MSRKFGRDPSEFKVDRRRFMKGLVGAAASVAIGLKLAHGTPRLDLNEENVEAACEQIRFKATERYSVGWTDPRALFGTQTYFDGQELRQRDITMEQAYRAHRS